jgi:GTP-binding protein EngB required for normal cell division
MASLRAQQKQKQNILKQKQKLQDLQDENVIDAVPRKLCNKLRSVFQRMDPVEILEKKNEATVKIESRDQKCLEVDLTLYSHNVELPIRPEWTTEMTKEQVELQEQEYFKSWISNIESQYGTNLYYEQNLEVWRQLWRVVEMSDMLLVVCDIRNPLLHFPPSLYTLIAKRHNKRLIIVLNKIDLVNDQTIHAWKEYFESQYSDIIVATFSCDPKSETKVNCRRFYRAVGIIDVLHACKSLNIKKKIEIKWDDLIQSTMRDVEDRNRRAKEAEQRAVHGRAGNREGKTKHARRRNQLENEEEDNTSEEEELIQEINQMSIGNDYNHYVTIGLIGHPNVGKSSLIVICFDTECIQG